MEARRRTVWKRARAITGAMSRTKKKCETCRQTRIRTGHTHREKNDEQPDRDDDDDDGDGNK